MADTLKRYVSAIEALDVRDITPDLIDIQNNYGLTDVMGAFGREKPATMYKTESFVDNPLWKAGVVGSVTGSGTAAATVVLTAGTSGDRRVNDLVGFPDGKVGVVTTVTPGATDTLVITSVDGTNLTAAAADTLKFFSNVVGEKSKGRDSVFLGAQHMYQYLQIFRENHRTSDVQLLSKTEAPKEGLWYYKEYWEKFLKLKAEVNAAHIAGRISVSNFASTTNAIYDPGNGGIIQTERGLHQYITSYGVNDTVAASGTFGLKTDGKDLIAKLVANKADNKYIMMGSTAALGPVDDELKGLGSSEVTSGRMMLDGKNIDFSVDSFKYQGFLFQKMLLPILNQPELFGGSIYAKGLYLIPQGNTRTIDRDQVSTYQPRIQIRYKPQPASISKNAIWGEFHGGMYSKVQPTSDVAEANVNWITAQAIEILGPQVFGFLQTV